MASSWAFKITASLIKPTREALLDYLSYVLLALSIIGIARVIIGNAELKEDCSLNKTKNLSKLNSFNVTLSMFDNINTLSDRGTSLDELPTNNSYNYMNKTFCPKYYQSYFPYILLVESLGIFLIGILWVKMPKVQALVHEFASLLHESRNSDWIKSVTTCIPITSLSEVDKIEVGSLFEVLFNSSTSYNNKAQARRLYEKIQKFTFDHEHSKHLLLVYVRKSALQLLAWLMAIFVNMILYVKLEFFRSCEPSANICSHDTFLRIMWVLGQMLLLVYAVFNCASLKWISDNTVSGKKILPLFVFIFCRSRQTDFQCRPYRVVKRGQLIFNDMALLLHLVSVSNRCVLPSFTIFLLEDWKTLFAFQNYSSSTRYNSRQNTEYRACLLRESEESSETSY